MFQSSSVRKTAEDTPICKECLKENSCEFKPDKTEWRYVLSFCQKYEPSQVKE